jgi:hypothetical protein
VPQISGGNAQANGVNSTDLVWSRLVRDQEVDGSNPFAPTTSIRSAPGNNQQLTSTRMVVERLVSGPEVNGSPRPLQIAVFHTRHCSTAHTSLSLNNLDYSAMTGYQRNFAIAGYQRGIEQFG